MSHLRKEPKINAPVVTCVDCHKRPLQKSGARIHSKYGIWFETLALRSLESCGIFRLYENIVHLEKGL